MEGVEEGEEEEEDRGSLFLTSRFLADSNIPSSALLESVTCVLADRILPIDPASQFPP